MKAMLETSLTKVIKNTVFLRTFGLLKIPMIFFVRPTVIEFTDQRAVVKVPLSYRTRNHLGSMYFGALCTGADCAGGILAMKLIQPYGKRASIIFKDFSAEFLKRPMKDVHFVCDEGSVVKALIDKAVSSGERENAPVAVRAEVDGEVMARFRLTISVKVQRA